MKRRIWPAALLTAMAFSACEDQLPTSVDGELIPVDPVTVEVRIPWSEFASGLRVFGGFGIPQQLGRGVLARAYEGTLDARTLVRFRALPRTASVLDSTGTTRPDTMLAFVGGRLVLRLDTLASTNAGPVTLAAGRTLTPWDVRSATWLRAVDTFQVVVPWPEAGGGPVAALGQAVWDPALGDSAVFQLDSAQVAALADTTETEDGLRLDVATAGVRVEVAGVALYVTARPSINPDTLVELAASERQLTFIYAPAPEPEPDVIRVGGVPSFRTVFDVRVPASLQGPPALCAAAGCPAALTPERISHAEIVLTTRASAPAFQPTDSVRLDVRPVLAPQLGPKAPLGGSFLGNLSLIGLGLAVPPQAFGAGAGRRVAVPVTPFVRSLLTEREDGDAPAPSTLALLSVFEPLSIAFASFVGPGEAGEPYLRLLVTAARPVELP